MALLTEKWIFDICITLTTAFILLYLYLIRSFDYWKKRAVPFIKPVPVFGNIADVILLRKQMGLCLRDMYNKMHTPFFGMFLLDKPIIVLKDPELIKLVLIKDFDNFSDHVMECDETCDPIGANLLFTLKNPEWRIIRNEITPIFTSGKIRSMFGLIKEVGEDMANYLKDRCDHNDIIEVKEVCGRYTTDVIASCGFGLNANSFKNENADFRRVTRDLFAFKFQTAFPQLCYFFFPSLAKLFRMKLFPGKVTDFFRNVFWATIREREESKIIRHDFVDTVINIRQNKSIQESIKFEGDKVIGQAVQFFVAGFEATSAVLTLVLFELAQHPEIQQRVRKDVLNCLQTGFTMDAIRGMKYLDMVISETTRKHPVLPFLDRLAVKDYELPGSNLVIEKGMFVYISVYGLHYDPQYYPEPEKFDPERFNEENKKTRPACTYLPFGEGPRNCIGIRFGLVNLKVAISYILQEFELESCDSTPTSIIYSPLHFMLTPTTGINLRFKKRQLNERDI